MVELSFHHPHPDYWSNFSTDCDIWFDCCSAAIPVCCRTVYFARFDVVVPMFASMIPLSAFWTLVIWLFITLVAAWSWLELAPRVPRREATSAIALLISVSA